MQNTYYKLQKKDKSLYLLKAKEPVKASYSQVPLSESQYNELLCSGNFKALPDSKGYKVSNAVNNPIDKATYKLCLAYFNNIVNNYKHTNLWEAVPNKILKMDIPGTSKLIRSPDKLSIRIARRKGASDNECRINVMPISNNIREEFFSDCKKLHPEVYVLEKHESEEIFECWSTFMDTMYDTLLKESKK